MYLCEHSFDESNFMNYGYAYTTQLERNLLKSQNRLINK
jgi:hypothetical protein